MGRDDIAFAAILIGSVVVSAALRLCPLRFRADAAALCGALTILGACGPHNSLHPLTSILLALLAMHASPPRYHKAVAFVLAFGYLSYLRLMPSPPGGPTNACMLLLTLRLSTADAPSTLELIRYACCYHGLFTGPYYSHAEWDEAMRRAKRPPTPPKALAKALLAAVGALVFWQLVASQLPYKLIGQGSAAAARVDVWITRHVPTLHDEGAFWTRLLYFHASSYQFRWRFYACWLVMTLSGMLLGFTSTSNVDLAATELATSPSMYIAGWNTSVQRWLKLQVYRQLPAPTPRPVRMLATFAVSALWHGMHLGYYLFFAGLFVMVCVEQLVTLAWARISGRARAASDDSPIRRAVLSATCHLWTMGCFSFFGGAFNLLGWRQALTLWRALSFYGIWLVGLPVLPAVVCLLVVSRAPPPPGPPRGRAAAPPHAGRKSPARSSAKRSASPKRQPQAAKASAAPSRAASPRAPPRSSSRSKRSKAA